MTRTRFETKCIFFGQNKEKQRLGNVSKGQERRHNFITFDISTHKCHGLLKWS